MAAATVVIRRDATRVVDDSAGTVVVAQPLKNVVRVEPVRVVVLGEASRQRVEVVDARQTVVVIKRPTTVIQVTPGLVLTHYGTPDGVVVGYFGQWCRDTLHGLFWQCRSDPSGDEWEVS